MAGLLIDADGGTIKFGGVEYIDTMIKPISNSSNIVIAISGTSDFFGMPNIAASASLEFRGSFLIKFSAPGSGNVVGISLLSPENYASFGFQVLNGSEAPFEITPSATTHNSVAFNDNAYHVISVFGLITNLGTIRTPTIRITNGSSNNTLTITAKSFIKYAML